MWAPAGSVDIAVCLCQPCLVLAYCGRLGFCFLNRIIEPNSNTTSTVYTPMLPAPMSSHPTLDNDSAIRLLLIEDNEPNRRLLSDFLGYQGFEVASVADGAECFSALESFQPHVILLDLKLPQVDGFTLLDQLQSHPRWQHIPVIVLTAFAFRADRQRAMNLGARRYFVKPANLNDLRAAIEEEAHCLSR